MDFEGYKTRIQKVSNLIENAKCPEDILNNRDLNLVNDFQYICLSSNVNGDLVNEVIARLAQNGNGNLIEDNIKEISMGMWKYLFDKNTAIKDIFARNFMYIIENNGIMTYREIENFVNDKDTINIVYENMEVIIKKLCTYDRASLISSIKTKEHGIDKIREHMEYFFQKGEFDISTTYSKILKELGSISEISTVEILETCSKYLNDMLERETAIDNETNDLLNWIYDSMESTQMYNEQRALLQKDIDDAIIANFEGILDKANYDKETIKILKQFPCTIKKFDGNKNLFIEKSNKLIYTTRIYDLYENKKSIKNSDTNNIIRLEDYNDNKLNDEENYANKCIDKTYYKKMIGEDNMENTKDKVKNFYEVKVNNDTIVNYIHENKNNMADSIDVSDCDNLEQDNIVIDMDNQLDNKYLQNDEFFKEIKNEIDALQQYTELLKQSNEQVNIKAEDVLSAIIKGNLYDTDKIIEKVLKKDENISNNSVQNKCNIEENNVIQSYEKINGNSVINQNNINYAVENVTPVRSNAITQNENINNESALVVKKENQIGFNRVLNVIKRLINKIKNIFAKFRADRLGD